MATPEQVPQESKRSVWRSPKVAVTGAVLALVGTYIGADSYNTYDTHKDEKARAMALELAQNRNTCSLREAGVHSRAGALTLGVAIDLTPKMLPTDYNETFDTFIADRTFKDITDFPGSGLIIYNRTLRRNMMAGGNDSEKALERSFERVDINIGKGISREFFRPGDSLEFYRKNAIRMRSTGAFGVFPDGGTSESAITKCGEYTLSFSPVQPNQDNPAIPTEQPL